MLGEIIGITRTCRVQGRQSEFGNRAAAWKSDQEKLMPGKERSLMI
jgi:hypothetical protein